MEEEAQWSSFPQIPEYLRKNLEANGFDMPFPVQIAVLEKFFSTDVDLAIGFPTGSGKTLSYLIPIVSALSDRIVQKLRALIVVPNSELAVQVFNVVACLIEGSQLTASVLSKGYYAGVSAPDALYPDILICSSLGLSSYLVDHDENLLADVEYIVLDEGDAILAQPLENWLDHVQRSLKSDPIPPKFTVPLVVAPPQNRRIRRFLCSATLSRSSKQSEDFQMQFPELLISSDKSRYVVPTGITEQFVVVDRQNKIATLQRLTEDFANILCFVSTSKRCVALGRIVQSLMPELAVVQFAASASAAARRRALDEAASVQQGGRLIIATDSLARGVDLPFIDCVVNFDVPGATRTYIHRMGRTARGASTGTCVSLLLESELVTFRDIVGKIDGSAPARRDVDIHGLTGRRYHEATRGFDALRVREAPKRRLFTEDDLDDDDEDDAPPAEAFNEEEEEEKKKEEAEYSEGYYEEEDQ